MALTFVHFGDDQFNKFSNVRFSKNKKYSALNSAGIVFDTLCIDSEEFSVQDVFPNWSYSLFLVDGKLFHCGFMGASCNDYAREIFCAPAGDDSIENIACSWTKVLIKTKNGHLFCLLEYTFEQLAIKDSGNTVKIKSISAGDLHNLVLKDDGDLLSVQILPAALNITPVLTQHTVSEISCGKEHVLILTAGGQVFTYGHGSRGQLGHGDTSVQDAPKLLDPLDGIPIKAVAAGGWHSAAISAIGDLYMWGWNESGQLGLPCILLSHKDTPEEDIVFICCLPRLIELKTESPVQSVSCGTRHSAALTEDGSLWAWGCNAHRQLGYHGEVCLDSPKIIQLPDGFCPRKLTCAFWDTLISGTFEEKNRHKSSSEDL